MISVCCTPPALDYTTLTPAEKLRFGFLVNKYRKAGKSLEEAQKRAYYEVLCEGIPYTPAG